VPGSSKVLVVPSEGGDSRTVYAEGTVVDWTRDGRYLAINSGSAASRANEKAGVLKPRPGMKILFLFVRRFVIKHRQQLVGGWGSLYVARQNRAVARISLVKFLIGRVVGTKSRSVKRDASKYSTRP
jgi:hypothetical protein